MHAFALEILSCVFEHRGHLNGRLRFGCEGEPGTGAEVVGWLSGVGTSRSEDNVVTVEYPEISLLSFWV